MRSTRARGTRVVFLELGERLVEREHVLIALHGIPVVYHRQADALLGAAPLLGDSRPRVIDQDWPHRLRGNREEVRAIVERDRFGAEQGVPWVSPRAEFDKISDAEWIRQKAAVPPGVH